jgi:hypothetical protein
MFLSAFKNLLLPARFALSSRYSSVSQAESFSADQPRLDGRSAQRFNLYFKVSARCMVLRIN